MEWFNRKILIAFASSNILWQITFVSCELFILRIIDPDLIGIWQMVILIQSYSIISRLGIINAMNREFPYLLGQENLKKANDVHTTTLGFVLMNGVLISAVFVGLAFYFGQRGFNWQIAFFSMSIIVFLEFINNYFEAILRGHKHFGLISKFQLGLIPVLILSLFLPWEYNFGGLCMRAIIISIVKFFILLVIVLKYLSIPQFKIPIFKELFNIGWRLWIWNYLKNISKSFPRLVIATFQGTGLLGLYAPVNWVNMAFTSLSGSIGSYIYPHLSYNLAKNDSSIGQQSLLISKYTVLIFLPLTVIGVILIPYFIPIILPKYISAIKAMQVSLIAGLFDSINISTAAFATLKAWKPMFSHVTISILIKGTLVLMGYFLFEDKLLGVISGLCVSSILMFGITWKMVGSLDNMIKER